jgi:hypothetical protein
MSTAAIMAFVPGLLDAGAALGVVLSYYLFARYEAHTFHQLGIPPCTGFGPSARQTRCGSGPYGFRNYLPAAFMGGIPLAVVAVVDVVTGVRLWGARFARPLRQQRVLRLARVLSGLMLPVLAVGGFFSLLGLAFLNVKKDDRATLVAISVFAVVVLAALVLRLTLFVVTLMARAKRAVASSPAGQWQIPPARGAS